MSIDHKKIRVHVYDDGGGGGGGREGQYAASVSATDTGCSGERNPPTATDAADSVIATAVTKTFCFLFSDVSFFVLSRFLPCSQNVKTCFCLLSHISRGLFGDFGLPLGRWYDGGSHKNRAQSVLSFI